MQTRAIQGPVPRRGIRSRKRSINCHSGPGVSKSKSQMEHVPLHPNWQISLSLGSCMGFSGEKHAWRDPSFSGCCHRSLPRQGTHQPQARFKQNQHWSASQPFPLSSHFQGKGLDGCTGSRASRPGAGAVSAPAAALPKETQTSYPKKALFISSTGSRFCTGQACSGQLSPCAEPGRASRAGLWPKPPFPAHIRSIKTSQCDHV